MVTKTLKEKKKKKHRRGYKIATLFIHVTAAAISTIWACCERSETNFYLYCAKIIFL